MRDRTILMIAPGHGVYEERVLRTVDVARRHGFCYYALEPDRLDFEPDGRVRTPERITARLGGGVKVMALPEWKKWPRLSRFTRQWFAWQIARQARDIAPDVVHVHESGSLGLLIADRVKRLVPKATVIFDYHDWIPWEIAETCRNHEALYRRVLPAALAAYRRLARAVDVAICISPGHAEWTRRELGIERTVVVENVRPPRPRVEYPRDEVRHQIVFIGHVVWIRRLEVLVDAVAELRGRGVDASLAVCGHVSDPAYAERIMQYAAANGVGERVVFHGLYRSDDDLLAVLGRGSIGALLAVPEPIDTGIMAIASANKFYSYMALGIPTLIEAGFDSMLRVAREHGAGDGFSSVTEFVDKAHAIFNAPGGWERMSQSAFAVAEKMNSAVYEQRIEELYGDLLADVPRAGGRGNAAPLS